MGTLFRMLTEEDIENYRQWARENYEPYSPIQGYWHPVIQHECAKINAEYVPHPTPQTDWEVL